MRKPAGVAIGHGNQLDSGNLYSGSGVKLPLAAGANERDLNVVVGGG
jgi:hypothetical protein